MYTTSIIANTITYFYIMKTSHFLCIIMFHLYKFVMYKYDGLNLNVEGAFFCLCNLKVVMDSQIKHFRLKTAEL